MRRSKGAFALKSAFSLAWYHPKVTDTAAGALVWTEPTGSQVKKHVSSVDVIYIDEKQGHPTTVSS